MRLKSNFILSYVFIGLCVWFSTVGSTYARADQHTEVSMRMIGHQVLLSLGDSTSRVLPIESEKNRYIIRFESEYGFNPDEVATVIDSVIDATDLSSHYIVEFVKCKTDEVAHSYEINRIEQKDVLACRQRDQPTGCYSLQITLLDVPIVSELSSTDSDAAGSNSQKTMYWVIAVFLIIGSAAVYLLKKRSKENANSTLIDIGDYRFDKRRMELHYRDDKIELTSKECQLLELLYDSVNDTVERDTILKMVWDDEGDYVGRTLDVFISKLRKKLEADSSIKIANIRGVGYKLIVDA